MAQSRRIQLMFWKGGRTEPEPGKPSCPEILIGEERNNNTGLACACHGRGSASASIVNDCRHFGEEPIIGDIVDKEDIVKVFRALYFVLVNADHGTLSCSAESVSGDQKESGWIHAALTPIRHVNRRRPRIDEVNKL